MNYKNRLFEREVSILLHAGIIVLSVILFSLIVWATGGCAYKGNSSLNFSLINSRSPAINADGTNGIEATTGFTGGGHLEAKVPMSAIP